MNMATMRFLQEMARKRDIVVVTARQMQPMHRPVPVPKPDFLIVDYITQLK